MGREGDTGTVDLWNDPRRVRSEISLSSARWTNGSPEICRPSAARNMQHATYKNMQRAAYNNTQPK